MTSFLPNAISPVITPVVAKDKGDFSNRMQCAGAQLGNNANHLLANAIIIGGSAGVSYAATKNPNFGKAIVKGSEKVAGKISPKLLAKFRALPSKFKVLAPITLVATTLLSYVNGKWIYKMGQIDQKYTDKANIEKHQDCIV